MAAIYSNGGNRWNILGFNFTKRDALSSVYKISTIVTCCHMLTIQHLFKFVNMLKHVNMIQYMYVHFLYCAQVFGGSCCWPR